MIPDKRGTGFERIALCPSLISGCYSRSCEILFSLISLIDLI